MQAINLKQYYPFCKEDIFVERRGAVLTERGEMWAQYNKYKAVHKQLAKVKPEKREQFEQRHSRELILYDAAARYLKELKDSGEAITPKAWQWEIDQLTAGKQTDTLAMKSMREDLKAVERLRKTAEQLSRQERDKSHDSIPLWAVTLIGGLLITVLSFTMILTVYGRMFSLWMYAAIAPIPLSTFAGEPTSSVGKNFIRSYAGVCLQGVVIALSCIIFSAISSSPPAVDTGASVVTAVWTYVGELAFNLLVLVGAIKGCDRIVKEIMGL